MLHVPGGTSLELAGCVPYTLYRIPYARQVRALYPITHILYSPGALAGGRCAVLLATLAERATAGELTALAAQPEALRLVLPTVMTVLEHAASGEGDAHTARRFQQVRALQPPLLQPLRFRV